MRVSYSEHPPLPRPGAAPTTFYYPHLAPGWRGVFTNKSNLTTARATTELAKADVQLGEEELTRANIEQKRIDNEVRQAGAAVARVKTNLDKIIAEQTYTEDIVRESTAKLVEARKAEAKAAKK